MKTNGIFILVTLLIFSLSCGKDENEVLLNDVFFNAEGNSNGLPTVSTNTYVTRIDATTSECGGNVISEGSSAIAAKGICWGLGQNPSLNQNFTTDGIGAGSFVSRMTGLTPGATYFARAYASNNAGTSYGNQISFVAGQNSTIDLSQGLVAYYPFNGNSNDMSGNNLHGAVHSLYKTTNRFGTANAAAKFSGSADSWMEVPHNDLLNLGPNFTISAWIFKEDGSYDYVLGKGRDISCGSWALGTTGIGIDGSCGTGASMANSINLSQWYMLTGVLNGPTGKLRFYLNGQLMKEVNTNPFTGNNNYPMAIGRHITSPSSLNAWPYPFKGKIDEVRIYNRALNETEIEYLYSLSD